MIWNYMIKLTHLTNTFKLIVLVLCSAFYSHWSDVGEMQKSEIPSDCYTFCTETNRFPMSCRKRTEGATLLFVLDYAAVIYRHAASSALKPLDSVYHSALRFITGASCNTYRCLLHDMTCWPSLEMRWNAHWLLFIFKALLGKLTHNIVMLTAWTLSYAQSGGSRVAGARATAILLQAQISFLQVHLHCVCVPVGERSESEGRVKVCLGTFAILCPAQRGQNTPEFRRNQNLV